MNFDFSSNEIGRQLNHRSRQNAFMQLGDVIREAREARDMTQTELGESLGVTKAAVSVWESNKIIPDHKKLPALAYRLGLALDIVRGLAARELTVETLSGALASITDERGNPIFPPRTPLPRQPILAVAPDPILADVPLWGSAEGGEEGAIVLLPDPIGYLKRSERLTGVKNPFAFNIMGTSMSPRLEHGDQVVINPARTARGGDDCVFIQQREDGTFLALVKRLARETSAAWKVRQFNPPKDFDLPRGKWKAHVIVEIRPGGG